MPGVWRANVALPDYRRGIFECPTCGGTMTNGPGISSAIKIRSERRQRRRRRLSDQGSKLGNKKAFLHSANSGSISYPVHIAGIKFILVANRHNTITNQTIGQQPAFVSEKQVNMPDKPAAGADLRNGDDYVRRLSKAAARRRLRRSAERKEKSPPSDAADTKTSDRSPPPERTRR